MRKMFPFLSAMTLLLFGSLLAHAQNKTVAIQWDKPLIISRTTPTLQVVVNPMLKRGSPIHEGSFSALANMNADVVRFVPWFPYPHAAVAELKPPTATETFWDFSQADPIVQDFMSATAGHATVMNFSTTPAWMWKTAKPVDVPADPGQVFWDYNPGRELRDTTMRELTGYFVRLFSWYTKGGFTDELGRFHASPFHYAFPYWEVLNEPDLEHHISPQLYTKMYDAIVTELKKISPGTKFVGMSLASERDPEWFEYFLDPRHHQPGVPPEGISYHFYARPSSADQSPDGWQYSFFDQAEGFLDRVRYIESIRKRLAPGVFTQINEIGVIIANRNYEGVIPEHYWNLAGAMYAYLYVQLSRMGIDVAGESQLVGYPTQFPDVTMIDWKNGRPNARYWALKLLRDHVGPGDTLLATAVTAPEIAAQAFAGPHGRQLLLINKRSKAVSLDLPAAFAGAAISYVDMTTGENPPAQGKLSGRTVQVAPFGVMIVSWPVHN